MKKYIISTIFAWGAMTLQAQDTLFVCDFESGIPETFTTYDRDGQEPSRSMKRYGFEVGKAWVSGTEEDNTYNMVAYSGSWYKEVAQSDDWLVTPAIRVADIRAILSWRACALDAEHADGYSVYITDKGNRPEDFTDAPVLTIPAESSAWKEHFLPLEAYSGKEVYVAFVNNSTNGNLLMVDDITVLTRKHTFIFNNLTPEAVTKAGGVRIEGTLTSSGFLPVEGYKLELAYGGETYTIDRSTESIAPDSAVNIAFDTEVNVAPNTTEDYTLTISSMEGADVETIQGSITCFERTVLIEEGTGTWCMWCPRGQYYLKELHKKRPGEFVDIAVHVSDEMMVYDYAMALYAPFFATYGLPSCVMDRQQELMNGLGSLEEIEAMLDKARERGAIGRIYGLMANAWKSMPVDRKLNKDAPLFHVSGNYEFGKAIKDGEYRLSFIVVEDSVTGYAQANAYSGSSGAMGGINLLPDPIPAGEYYFANVGRAVYDSCYSHTDENGKECLAIEAQSERHTRVLFDYWLDYPTTISDVNKVRIVALIIDVKSGEVVNATETKMPYFYTTSIDGLPAPTPIRLQGDALTAGSPLRQVEMWSLSGQLLHKATPDSERYTLPLMEKGQTIVIRAMTDEATKTFKYITQK